MATKNTTPKMTHMQEVYVKQVRADLKKKFNYSNDMQIPRLSKIVLNMGVGKGHDDKKQLQGAVDNMTAIAGQKPVVTRAKKSVAAFKVRQGMAIGCKVTLRGARMYEFLDRLINIALPRVRDFEGVSAKTFDGQGNYALGIKEQLIFPEIDFDKIDRIRGMDVVIATTARTDDEARALLQAFGMPFRIKGGQK